MRPVKQADSLFLSQLGPDFFDLFCMPQNMQAHAEQHFMAIGLFEDGMPGHLGAQVFLVFLDEFDAAAAAF
jgi:hypothetical protein